MSDLERALRRVLERKAAELQAAPPRRVPGEIRRRILRWQAGTMAASIFLLVGVGAGGVALVRSLTGPAVERPAEPAVGPSVSPGPSPHAERAVLASGRLEGEPWRLVARLDHSGEWCLAIEVGGPAAATCGLDVPPGDVELIVEQPPGLPVLLAGAVSPRVASVEVRHGDGSEVDPAIHEPPPGLGIPYRAFVTTLAPDDRPGAVEVFDGVGTSLQEVRYRAEGLLAPVTDRKATPQEREILRTLVDFARAPGSGTFAEVPFAPEVALGLGSDIYERHPASALSDPSVWTIDAEDFRALVGPFSALETLAETGPLRYLAGPHNHCASPPVPAPDGFSDERRISVQPRLGSDASCLLWFTIDAFLDGEGRIAAVTLDFWEA